MAFARARMVRHWTGGRAGRLRRRSPLAHTPVRALVLARLADTGTAKAPAAAGVAVGAGGGGIKVLPTFGREFARRRRRGRYTVPVRRRRPLSFPSLPSPATRCRAFAREFYKYTCALFKRVTDTIRIT